MGAATPMKKIIAFILLTALAGCTTAPAKTVVFIKRNPTKPIDINRVSPADAKRYCSGRVACAWASFGICTVIIPTTDTGVLLQHELDHCHRDFHIGG